MANEIAVLQKDVTDTISSKLTELEHQGLALPPNYNPQNALKSAFFNLQNVTTSKKEGNKPALSACSKTSIANALLDMVVQGLSPAKTQCYFITYRNYQTGNTELQLQRSYFGTQAVLKRLDEVNDIWAEVIHEGDEFEIGSVDGRMVVDTFNPKFINQDNPITGVFAVIKRKDDGAVYTVMTKKQIEQAWSHGQSDKVQKEFPEEMAKRTVINRAAKNFINTSDDSDLLVQSINSTTSNEYENDGETRKDVTKQGDSQSKINSLIGGSSNGTNDITEPASNGEPEIVEPAVEADAKEVEGAIEQPELL